MRDFKKELNDRIKAINQKLESPKPEKAPEIRYDLVQYTLPGSSDLKGIQVKKIGLNLSLEDIRLIQQTHFKQEYLIDGSYENRDVPLLRIGVQKNGSVIFYQPIRTDATLEERSPYYNEKSIILEEEK